MLLILYPGPPPPPPPAPPPSNNHLTHHLSHTSLSTTIFHTPSFTHIFVNNNLSHTIFHTPSFTHTIFHTPSLTHQLGDIHLHFAWQAWNLWHWAGSGGALGPVLVTGDVVALCVAGVALMALGWLWWRAWACFGRR